MSEAVDVDGLAAIEQRITAWLIDQLATNPAVAAVDRAEGDQRRWYVRLRGEDKEFTTIWLTLGQRTLSYETYVLPAPEENAEAVYEQALRRNMTMVGARFAIGDEDALYLVGELPLTAFDEAELDRVVGTVYAYVERTFRALLRVAFASRFP